MGEKTASCPKCGFTHGWDGSQCSHCRFVAPAGWVPPVTPEEPTERLDKPQPPLPREVYRKEARYALLLGLGLLVFNFVHLLLEQRYYPVIFLFAPPTILFGACGLLLPPKRYADGKLEFPGGWLAVCVVVGLVIGGILAYDPVRILRAFGVLT